MLRRVRDFAVVPLADFGESLPCGAAAGCCSCGSAGSSDSAGTGWSRASALSSGGVLSSPWRRKNESLWPRL
ncbi:hypothetical protein, partial [Salmonella sp. SAL4358]|uniref:hypothetical protein n=1 Tax=Salmonella sp. SAL4358 TaxID=3159879 RepID=UPI00397CD299